MATLSPAAREAVLPSTLHRLVRPTSPRFRDNEDGVCSQCGAPLDGYGQCTAGETVCDEGEPVDARTRSRYSRQDRLRVQRAVRAAVATRTPGAVVAADVLHFESVALEAAGWPNPRAEEVLWCRDVVARAMADREQASHR
jgi:hypothetical protein